ncbi:Putative phage-type endonuclease [Candidatus Glomeribacter gigasporarum BEG34]|uniref:Putative phage-type endonuclease n=1 Tax=Candidatus Glomeribacter gigasporarum BEG34 TaxID=1070319 RepID=G2JBC4_9BURK|nr:YqaJ viral recombinase family protein [Candidatus Glomeribacter gigasporarum]CCD30078.1 Putative phage-type endonuclease [Candidatus Glomeribacter gigasporarum BEG34]
MKIIDIAQRSNAWHVWRRRGVTASDAAVLLGRSPYKTLWRLWAEKTGIAVEEDVSRNPFVQYGLCNEDIARQAFEARHGEILLPVCVEDEALPLMRASLDGHLANQAPVELKCPGSKVWEAVRAKGAESETFRLCYPQVQHQILVTGADDGYLVFWHQGEIQEFQIPRDGPLIRSLIEKAMDFWKRVESKQEPAKDPERDVFTPKEGEQVAQWAEAAERYQILNAQITALKERLEGLKAEQGRHRDTLKCLMGPYLRAQCGGIRVARYAVAGNIQYERLLQDKLPALPQEEIERYRDAPSERCCVRVIAPKQQNTAWR